MAASSGGRALFTRQSSGLVREVSVTNALLFNTAAFIGVGVGWYPTFYSLAFVAIGTAGAFTTYGVAAILIGLACILLSLIFASLTSVMPRSGGDYVFTSRIVPRIGPFLGWLESWTLAFASVAIIAFEVPVFIRDCPVCRAEGRVRSPGDEFSREKLLDMTGLIQKKGPMVAITQNFGGQTLASAVSRMDAITIDVEPVSTGD